MVETVHLVHKITEALENHKALEIVTIDLRRIENCFSRFFVICHGHSTTHVSALAEAVKEEIEEESGEKPLHTEGERQALWVIIDYGDVVVHLFQKEQRDFYQLEDFWGDGIKEEITESN